MKTTSLALFMLCLSMVSAGNAGAESGGYPPPLPVGNRSPVTGVFGIPGAQGAALVAPGETGVDLNLDITSHFVASESGFESVVLDGETARLALSLRYGLNDQWDLGVEIPWLRHGGGFLDDFILDWHDLFGFRQRGRDEVPGDRILFRYRRDGVERFRIDEATSGIGDVVVSARHALFRDEHRAAAVYTQLKLPTGDPDRFTGSGAFDAGGGIELAARPWPDWHAGFRAGAAYLGRGDVLPNLQRRWVGYGGLDIVWRPLDLISLRVQYDVHSATYRNSDLDELSDWSGLLTTGGTLHFSPRASLDLAVVENVPNSFVVPDVTFQLRLRTVFGGAD